PVTGGPEPCKVDRPGTLAAEDDIRGARVGRTHGDVRESVAVHVAGCGDRRTCMIRCRRSDEGEACAVRSDAAELGSAASPENDHRGSHQTTNLSSTSALTASAATASSCSGRRGSRSSAYAAATAHAGTDVSRYVALSTSPSGDGQATTKYAYASSETAISAG